MRVLPQRFAWCVALLSIAVLQSLVAVRADVRDDEIAQCRPGEVASWADNLDRPAASDPMVFIYDHANAPNWFDEQLVLAAIDIAARSWSQCGIPAQVKRQGDTVTAQFRTSIRWSDSDSAGNFGLTNFARRSLVLGPAAFQLLRDRNPAHDARDTLQMVISHEMGHLFGLMSHSRRCVDVTSNYDNDKGERCYARDPGVLRRYPEYRSSLPTACDIERCRMANGLTSMR